jgi:uncharacterized protein YceK
MKKIFLIIIACIILLTGCASYMADQAMKAVAKKKSSYSPAPIKTTSMKIVEHTWDFKGDYVIISGSVQNTGETNIRYFEVVVEYLDRNDNVIDSDYTNCAETIKPGNKKTFEIMSKIPGGGLETIENPDGLDGYQLYLQDVTAE